MKFVIRENGFLAGGIEAEDEETALNLYAQSEVKSVDDSTGETTYHKDVKDLYASRGTRRDNYTVTPEGAQ